MAHKRYLSAILITLFTFCSASAQMHVRFHLLDTALKTSIHNFKAYRDGLVDEILSRDSNGLFLIDTIGDFNVYIVAEGYSDIAISKRELTYEMTFILYPDVKSMEEIGVNSKVRKKQIVVGRRKTIAESHLPLCKGHGYEFVIDLSDYADKLNLISMSLEISQNIENTIPIPIQWQLFRLNSSFPYYAVDKESYAFNKEALLMADSLLTSDTMDKLIFDLKNTELYNEEKKLLLRIYTTPPHPMKYMGNIQEAKLKQKCKFINCICLEFNGRYNRYIPASQETIQVNGKLIHSSRHNEIPPRLTIRMTQTKIKKARRSGS